jgi:hypothetical protein
VIADLKTAVDASPRGWSRAVVNFQYHAQAAFYLDGLDTVEPVVERKFLWIALEKEEPHCVALYEPDFATLDKGRRMYRNYLRQYMKAQETQVWGGYEADIQSLEIPEWATRYEEGEEDA